jgi:hypothetical protein
MKAAILCAALACLVLEIVRFAMPPVMVCTPNAQNQLVCLGR